MCLAPKARNAGARDAVRAKAAAAIVVANAEAVTAAAAKSAIPNGKRESFRSDASPKPLRAAKR
jgi:hypothetical protein